MHCSVIVCTYNRAEILQQTLLTLLQQEYDPEQLEILVVDNASDDGTRAVITSLVDKGPYPVRYVFEPRQGLSYARNCGIHHAQGDVVVFLDDDALPQKTDWIARLMKAYQDPQVWGAGGDIELRWPVSGRPVWVHDFLLPNLGKTLYRHTRQTELHYPNYPWGGNISFLKRGIQQLNGFSTALGRNGDGQLSGEETELCLRIEEVGKKIVYIPDAVVEHIVAPERLTRAWFHQRAFGQGLSDAYISRLHGNARQFAIQFAGHIIKLGIYQAGKLWYEMVRDPSMAMYFSYHLTFLRAYLLRMLNLR